MINNCLGVLLSGDSLLYSQGDQPTCRKPKGFPSFANLEIFKRKLLFVRFRILPWSILCFTWDNLRDCFEQYEIVFVIVLNYMRTILVSRASAQGSKTSTNTWSRGIAWLVNKVMLFFCGNKFYSIFSKISALWFLKEQGTCRSSNIRVKVFMNVWSKIFGRQPLNILSDFKFLKAIFHTFHLVYSWIHWPIGCP